MLGTVAFDIRTQVAAGQLAPLAASLAEDLDRLLPDEDFFLPLEKARMSKTGGRCERDGQFLEFDPRSPRRHRCPVCGTEYDGDEHYRWWIMGYQLWLAERAVHAAALGRLTSNARHRRLGAAILDRLAEQYLKYPNVDNVLGPTRPFFSTYLESIWALQLCIALWLHEGDESTALGDRVRDRLLEPSSRLVFSFNEGQSNRQVWNNAMLAASGIALNGQGFEWAIMGTNGLESHLRSGLLSDGTWYEGENYHLFAHRGLWYLVMLADYGGASLPDDLLRRFEAGFVAPLRTALPDFTFPSRRDSHYRASLRQWRIAESFELGLARTGAAELSAGLETLYGEGPEGDTARWRSTAEAERNVPAVRLARSDLGWKSLLFARPVLPRRVPHEPASALMEGQGLGVIRAERGRIYVALDYGHSGGSHGHPDRLNLWLVSGDHRIFEDVGTGSYVERTLHWYRSTLAHNAPLIDGRSQERVSGTLRAWDARATHTVIDAEAAIAPGVLVRRTVIVADGYLIDSVEWSANRDVTCDLPMHVDAEVEGARWRPGQLTGGSGLEDGFDFVASAQTTEAPDGTNLVRGPGVDGVVSVDAPYEWWRAMAPGPPGSGSRRFLLIRARGVSGRIQSAWSWRGPVDKGVIDAHRDLIVPWTKSPDHRREDRQPSIPNRHVSIVDRQCVVPLVRHDPLVFALGEEHYRRTEQRWSEAGEPTASVALSADADDIIVEVSVANGQPNFAPPAIENPMDNEHPDTNSDGVQLHVSWPGSGSKDHVATWLMIPEPDRNTVRVNERDDARGIALRTSWQRNADGWQLQARIPRASLGPPDVEFGLDVIVNDMPRGRERRRGQLVLSGAKGEWAYLRGDRQDRAALIPMTVEHG